jgi:hypothetical protein
MLVHVAVIRLQARLLRYTFMQRAFGQQTACVSTFISESAAESNHPELALDITKLNNPASCARSIKFLRSR